MLYAPSFVGIKRVGTSREEFDHYAWLADRAEMFSKPMLVTASDRTVETKGDGFVVRFTQLWSSGSFSDRGVKVVELHPINGTLLITYEELLNSEVVK